jgi:hypothetical protein
MTTSKLTKENVLAAVDPMRKPLLEEMTSSQWDAYLNVLENYLSGSYAPDGWCYAIEDKMRDVGATTEQAFACAINRENVRRQYHCTP